MLNEISINYLAVLITAIVSFIIGAIWYSKVLFAKPWERLSNVKMGEGKNLPLLFIINFIATFIVAWVFAHTVKYAGATTFIDAILVGFFTWLGYFALATLLGTILWESKPFNLYLINAGYWLINLLVMATILTMWP